MATNRRYKLLCPVARALDRIGDRWTFLILRDLHAGPARFSDLQSGLNGIATNLLTDRLGQLVDDGLIEKKNGTFGIVVYALTDLGKQTRSVLFELALLGSRFKPDEEIRRPGNLRTVAVAMSAALQGVAAKYTRVTATIVVDAEPFALRIHDGVVDMVSGQMEAPDVTLETSYEPLIAVSEGEMSMDVFVKEHVRITARKPGKDVELMHLFSQTIARFSASK